MPPSMRRAGVGACTTTPGQARQANFGRLVTRTRNWTGSTSKRSAVSQPISTIVPRQQGQAALSGMRTCSTRGRWSGSRPRPFRRRAARKVLASSCFQKSIRPLPSHTRTFTRSARLDRNTSTTPENGSAPSSAAASAAKAWAPRRKSTGLVASRIRVPAGTVITARAPPPGAQCRPGRPCCQTASGGHSAARPRRDRAQSPGWPAP